MIMFGAISLFVISLAQAQTFEVASIKPAPSTTEWGYRFAPGGRAVLTGFRLRDLILLAWQVRDFQIIGTTGWMDAERFNIEAKAEGNPDREESRRMVQSLLADRFQLKLHRETRELPKFVLVRAKGELRLTPSKEGSCTPSENGVGSQSAPEKPGLPMCGIQERLRRPANGAPVMEDRITGGTMPWFARLLGATLSREVTDETGISGTYDFTFDYAPDDSLLARVAPGASPADNPGPSIFTALQGQLGLKLEPRKGPVEVFVVDHAERPSPN